MAKSRDQNVAIIRFAIDQDLDKTFLWGYSWFHRRFLPALKDVELRSLRRSSAPIRNLLARGWYLVGDIHDMNQSPVSAIAAYRKAIGFVPEYAAAWREMGTCQVRIGAFRAARITLLRAIQIDPSDIYAKDELELLSVEKKDRRRKSSDAASRAAEYLARDKPLDALRRLSRPRSTRALLWRACAHGALGSSDGQLNDWKRIEQLSATVIPEASMWFYLSPDNWRNPEFWQLLMRLSNRLRGGYVPVNLNLSPQALTARKVQMARREFFKERLQECRKSRR